jgi:hypothetical protein
MHRIHTSTNELKNAFFKIINIHGNRKILQKFIYLLQSYNIERARLVHTSMLTSTQKAFEKYIVACKKHIVVFIKRSVWDAFVACKKRIVAYTACSM